LDGGSTGESVSSIDRKCHVLKREKTLAMPRHLLFFDTETFATKLPDGSIEQIFRLGWACYWQRKYGRHRSQLQWLYFDDVDVFWRFVFEHTHRKQKLWVIARNIVFDFTVAGGWKHLNAAGFKLKFFHNAGLTTILTVRSKSGSIVFVDSLNWFRESIAETGRRIGLPKLSVDFESVSQEALKTYCRRDVEIEYLNFKQFIDFLESRAISRLCYTIASTAMAAYLFGHYKTKIWIHNNAEAIALERASYKGGRCECFYIGDLKNENYYVLDVNSLYPFVMSHNLYPVKYRRISQTTSKTGLANLLKDSSVVAEVLLNTDEPVYAVKRDKLIFPIGKFWGVLTTPELKYALEHKHIIEVGRYAVYEQGDIFSSYVTAFYKLRMIYKADGVKQYEQFCKYLMNSLYGKFGQKAENWEKVGKCPNEPDRIEDCYDSVTNRHYQIRYLLGEIFELTGYDESFNSFPAIASHVTAYARMYLYSLMKQAGKGNYFYCDTDSLLVNEAGLCRLQNKIHGRRLGLLKLENTTNQVSIRGLKDYTVGEKNVTKGLRKNAVKISPDCYEQDLWPSFKGLLGRHRSDTYKVYRLRKQLCRRYDKGVISSDGSVTPFRLADSGGLFQQPH